MGHDVNNMLLKRAKVHNQQMRQTQIKHLMRISTSPTITNTN